MNGELLDPAVATAGGRALWSTFGRRHGLSLLWMCRVRFAAGLAGAGVAAWLPPSRRHRLWPPTTTRSRSTPPPSSTLPPRHGQSPNCPEPDTGTAPRTPGSSDACAWWVTRPGCPSCGHWRTRSRTSGIPGRDFARPGLSDHLTDRGFGRDCASSLASAAVRPARCQPLTVRGGDSAPFGEGDGIGAASPSTAAPRTTLPVRPG